MTLSQDLMIFGGIPIIVSEHVTVEKRLFPKSKHRSKRIQKKLIKRHGGESTREPAIFQTMGKIYMHPSRYDEFKREIERANATR